MNHHEESRTLLSGGMKRTNKLAGMHKFSGLSGSLHPSHFCKVCGQCYYRPECVIGDPNLAYHGRGFRDAFRRILRGRLKLSDSKEKRKVQARIRHAYQLLGWEL